MIHYISDQGSRACQQFEKAFTLEKVQTTLNCIQNNQDNYTLIF